MSHSLTLGGLLLTKGFCDVTHGFSLNVLADGMSFGAAAGAQQVVTSLLADGDLVRTTRYGNREVTFAVEITGPSLGALARGEAALRREVGRSNTLTWQAPDVLSVPTVFDVVTSEMRQEFDDLAELRRRREFTITMKCAPFARSAGMKTVTALAPPPAVPTNITVTDADTTTGWNATANTGAGSVAVTVEDAGPYVFTAATCFSLTLGWTPTSPVSLAGTQYLLIETSSSPTGFYVLYTGDPGVTYLSPALSRMLPTGTVQYAFEVNPSRTLGYVGLLWDHAAAGLPGPSSASLTVHDVTRTDALPQVSSRQTSAVVPVVGTERTPCSLRVNPAAGEAMGLTIVHTAPESGRGYFPSLRRWRVSGNPETAEAGSLSGKKEAVTGTPIVAQMPIASLPEDGYALMAYMRSSKVGTFPVTWQARTIVGSTYYGGHEDVANITFTVANQWTLVPIAVMTLPPVRAAQGGVVQFNLTRTVVDEEIYLDEWWPFRVGDDCALTIVDSTEASFLWLDSPDISSSVPCVWVSNNSDRSDQRHPGLGLRSQDSHVLTPGGTSVFVASTGIQSPSVTVTYHPRWHSNAAE